MLSVEKSGALGGGHRQLGGARGEAEDDAG